MLAARAALQRQGYGRRAISIALQSISKQSNKAYDAKWDIYERWCEVQDPPLDPVEIAAKDLAEFFVYLTDDRDLSHSTISGYRTAINSVLIPSNNKAGTSKVIARIIKSVKVAIPPVREAQPKWNLRLVLAVLARAPFEPIGTCDFEYLTYKTAFLVLLGSACRRSELHALDYQTLQHDPHWKWVDLFTLPGFWAKHQASDTDPSRSRVYRLQAMDSTLDRKKG